MIAISGLPELPHRLRRAGAVLAVLVVTAAIQGLGAHPFDRLFVSLISTLQHSRAEGRPSALPDYRVALEGRPVADVAEPLRGLAVDERQGRLWSVAIAAKELLALHTNGEILARYPLEGFADIDAIASLDDDLLMLVENSRQTLVVVPTPAVPDHPLRRSDTQTRILPLPTHIGAVRGIAYDRDGDRLFVISSQSPRRLHEIRGLRGSLEGRRDAEIIDRQAWIGDKLISRDFSAIEFDASTRRLLLLSDASHQIIALDDAGRLVGYQPLARGFAGLQQSLPEAAGMRLDGLGRLYVLGKSNLFYAFRPD